MGVKFQALWPVYYWPNESSGSLPGPEKGGRAGQFEHNLYCTTHPYQIVFFLL